MSSIGRPKYDVWKLGFCWMLQDKPGINKKTLVAQCKMCNKILVNIAAERLKAHRKNCKLPDILPTQNDILVDQENCLTTPQMSPEIMSLGNKEDEQARILVDASSNCFELQEKSTSSDTLTEIENLQSCLKQTFRKRIKRNQSDIRNFHDTMTMLESKIADMALAKLFFGCNIPFSVVESKYFREFIATLRPAYKPPSRKVLSNRLLDETYEKICEHKNFNKKSVLLLDGWKNESSNTKNVVAMMHSATGEAMFLESWDFSGEHETGDKLVEIVNLSKSIALEKHGTEIYAVVTDNASNMLRMGHEVDIWHLPCHSHTGQLLAKDLVPQDLAKTVTKVLKEFSGPNATYHLLKCGGSRIKLPCDTRWCSNRDSFKCFLDNIPAMRKVIVENSMILPDNITPLLFEQKFINDVKDAINLLDPICRLINICQSSTTNIADAAEEWMKMQLPINDARSLDILHARREYALKIPCLAANYLHPTYRGKLLSDEQRDNVDNFLLNELDSDGLESMRAFENGDDIFETLNSKTGLSPTTYWNFARRKHSSLSEVALKLLTIPASSAQLERKWSYIHNPIRNKLSGDHSKKLLGIYYGLKISDNRSDEY